MFYPTETIVNWTNYVREVTHWVITSKQIGGERHVIQVDESLFGGCQKNNIGRLLRIELKSQQEK
ncbi:hypothetical protein HERIO_1750 [Hepatospora eriocheir]|uniref:Uncharacterized protein n=1 Tax=Hepatospora eriocheir TaxID=1081669 RepID=A0A1X0Q975_9MICR|nr:hypothetical protein HERIO_1750 [Hepatospora eriocheir]